MALIAPIVIAGAAMYALAKDTPEEKDIEKTSWQAGLNSWIDPPIGHKDHIQEGKSTLLGVFREPLTGIPSRVWKTMDGQYYRTFDVGTEDSSRRKQANTFE